MRWNERGFGFIRPHDGGDELFCHTSAIRDGNSLRDNAEVEYDTVWDDKRGKYLASCVTGGCDEDRRGGGGGDYGDRGGGGRSDICFDFQKVRSYAHNPDRLTKKVHALWHDRADAPGARPAAFRTTREETATVTATATATVTTMTAVVVAEEGAIATTTTTVAKAAIAAACET